MSTNRLGASSPVRGESLEPKNARGGLPRLVRSLRRLIAGGQVSAQQKEYYIVCQETFEREIAQLAQLEASAKRALQAL